MISPTAATPSESDADHSTTCGCSCGYGDDTSTWSGSLCSQRSASFSSSTNLCASYSRLPFHRLPLPTTTPIMTSSSSSACADAGASLFTSAVSPSSSSSHFLGTTTPMASSTKIRPRQRRKRGRSSATATSATVFMMMALIVQMMMMAQGTQAETTFDIIWWAPPTTSPSIAPSITPTAEKEDERGTTDHLLLASPTPPPTTTPSPLPSAASPLPTSGSPALSSGSTSGSSSNSVFGTRNGYDQPNGKEAICWKTTFAKNNTQQGLEGGAVGVQTELLPACSSSQQKQEPVLRLEGPIDPLLLEDDESEDDWLEDEENERLYIHKVYEYQVHINLNLTQLLEATEKEQGNMEVISSSPPITTTPTPTTTHNQNNGTSSTETSHPAEISIAIQILFCRVGQVSFCSPFVPEQVLATMEDDSTATSSRIQRPYFRSDWFHMTIPIPTTTDVYDNTNTTNTTTSITSSSMMINETISIPTVVDQVGSYFVLANLRFVTAASNAAADTTSSNSSANPTTTPSIILPHYQWDIANGLDPTTSPHTRSGGRVLQYQSPPEILEVSKGARITSYVAVGIASCILLGLLYQTIIHRKNQVLHLSQVGFLILFQLAALLATLSSLLVEPKNDLFCQLSHPMTLIPLQLMYSITIGRLWRINAVISPLLVEHFRKNLKSQRWTGKLVSWVQQKTAAATSTNGGSGGSGGNNNNSSHQLRSRGRQRRNKNVQLRRTVTSSRLALVISIFAIPQVILQICAWLLQPQERIIQLDYQTNQGMVMCHPTNVPDDFPLLGNLLYYAYGVLILLLLLLLIMAYSCRNLPSLFNETHVIYTIIFRTFLFVVFGAVLVIVLQTQQQHIAPDITYLLWLTIILYTTLASSLGLLLPKLKMIWKGEVVIVSKLVSDHHRARRERKQQQELHGSKHHNVTGIDLSQSGHDHSNSYSMAGSSFNTDSYLNGSFTGSFTGSYTRGGGGEDYYMDGSLCSRGDDPTPAGTDLNKTKDPLSTKLSDIRERSAASTVSLPITSAASESSNSFMPLTSEEVYDDDEDGLFGDDDRNLYNSSYDEEEARERNTTTTATRVPQQRRGSNTMEDWKSQMKSFRQKWSRSSFTIGGGGGNSNDATNQNRSRPSSEILPMTSAATDADEEFEDIDLNVPDAPTTEGTTTKVVPDHSRRRGPPPANRMQRQRSRKRRSLLVVSPDETPPRRLVMKMVNQQDCLNSITTKIMSGLSVRPDEWDKLVRLHTILEKCLQEEVNFTWKAQQQRPLQPPRRRSLKQPPPSLPEQIERSTSANSLHLSDLENPVSNLPQKSQHNNDNDDVDHRSAGGNSRDATLRRSNTQHTGTYKSFAKLSHVAKEFRRVVDCRDRQYMFTTYKNCFIGSDAIDSLIYAGLVESREEAVELGRRLAEELHLFKHVTGDHDFKDEAYFYEFYSDSDSDYSTSHEDEDEEDNKSIQLFDIHETSAQAEARAFREAIDVRDRRYHLKLYPKVFVGCEAVDALIYHGVAKSRWEAVQLGRRLARETKLFRHVCGDHELRDEWLFYRFSELDENGVESSLGSAMSDIGRPKSEIAELADAFEMYVDIRDRWYHAKKYKMCFIGSEAVDAMIYAGLVATREEGVALGRRLEKELRLFHHVCNDHEFKDDHLFYEMRRRGNRLGGSNRSGRSGHQSGSLLDESGSSNHDMPGTSAGESKSSSSQGEKNTKFSDMVDKAAAFRQCAVITTGTWRMKKYPNVFIGCDTVDRMVYTGLAKNRMEAVQLGRAIARELKLFRHVANDHAFSDSYLFYRFRSEDDSSSAGSISTFSKNSQITSPPRTIQGVGELSESQSQSQSLSLSLSQSNNNSLSSSITGRSLSALAEKAEIFRNLAKVKDRKYRLRTYTQCFVGEQVVDALVEAGVVKTREAAVKYGKELQSQLRLFQHVVGAHSFQDSYLFYRFRDLGFNEGVDVLGTSFNSVNELSVSSTIGGDYSRSDLDNDPGDMLGGSTLGGSTAGGRFGLPVLDENSELDAAGTIPTRKQRVTDDLGESNNLPALMDYDDMDAAKAETAQDANTEDSSNGVSPDNDSGDNSYDDGNLEICEQTGAVSKDLLNGNNFHIDGNFEMDEQTTGPTDVSNIAGNDDQTASNDVSATVVPSP